MAAAMGLLGAGCGSPLGGNGNGKPAEELTAKAERRDLLETVEAAGDLEPLESVDVKPEVSARVEKIFVEVGARVGKGERLFQLDDTELKSQRASLLTDIEGARLRMVQAARDLGRAQALFGKKLISQEVFDRQQTNLDVSKTDMEKAERQLQVLDDRLAKTVIMAPMEGTVLAIPVNVGQVVVGAASVNAGTLLMTFADLSRMLIKVHINQVDVAKVQFGQTVTFTVDSVPDLELTGRVSLVAPQATVKSGVKGFEVRVQIDRPDGRLRPGMTADVVFPVAESKQAVAVPLSAVFLEDEKQHVVYVRKAEGEPERREVKTGITNLDFVEIKAGVAEGEEVLLTRPAGTEPGRAAGGTRAG